MGWIHANDDSEPMAGSPRHDPVIARRVIVSRHPAAIEFLRAECPEFAEAPVLESASAEEIRGAVVGGNVPLHLAAVAAQVVAVEFEGPAPRGAEYGLAEMRAAGARIARYRVTAGVTRLPACRTEQEAQAELGAAIDAEDALYDSAAINREMGKDA